MNPSVKWEGLVRAGIILCRKSSTSCRDSSHDLIYITLKSRKGHDRARFLQTAHLLRLLGTFQGHREAY